MSQQRSVSFLNRKKDQLTLKSQTAGNDLALKIIDKEIELEKNWDPNVIHDLITLYSKIIEQYEQNNNPKYSDFQERMHKMLMKPEVIQALQKVNCSNSNKSGEPQKTTGRGKATESSQKAKKNEVPGLEKAQSNSKLSIDKILLNPSNSKNPLLVRKAQAEITRKTLSEKLKNINDKGTSLRKVDCIIERQSSTSRESAHKAVADFKSQESALERRKASRKHSQLARSMTLNSSGDFSHSKNNSFVHEEKTLAKVSIFYEEHPVENFANYEKKLESIMEQNYTERAMRIAEIKVKYEQQIEEISEGGAIMDMVVKQMKANMQEEISKVSAEFDLKRKEDIRRLKGCGF